MELKSRERPVAEARSLSNQLRRRWRVYRLFSESPILQGGDVESGCTVLYCLCRNDNQVLALEHQVCAIHKGRRGPDRPSSEPCSNGASSRNPPRDSLSPVGISFLQEGEDCQNGDA